MHRSSYTVGRHWIGRLAMCVGLAVSGCAPEADVPPAETEPKQPEVDFIQEAVWSPGGDRLVAAWHQRGRYRLYGVLGPDTIHQWLFFPGRHHRGAGRKNSPRP